MIVPQVGLTRELCIGNIDDACVIGSRDKDKSCFPLRQVVFSTETSGDFH
jgi:hypothetical protein